MTAWIELTNGNFVNLDRIEGVVPIGNSLYRFNPPRAQRGGRPTGRPTERVPGFNEDRSYWEGQPVDEAGMLLYLRGGRGSVVHWEDATPEEADEPGYMEAMEAALGLPPEGAQKPQDGVAPPAAPTVGSDPDAA